jgi:uncharacterized integral membrane protein (TIGR00697 family)
VIVPPSAELELERTTKPPMSSATTAAAAITLPFVPVSLLMFSPLNWVTPWGNYWDLNQTAGALNWPLVFITSDIINDYFGKKGVRFISFTTALFIAFSFFIIYTATLLVPADFWVEVNKGSENFNINQAFSRIFRQGLGIILGSLSAFLVSQIIDALVFEKIKARTGSKHIWLRATGSTLISQLLDSVLVIGIALPFWKLDFQSMDERFL